MATEEQGDSPQHQPRIYCMPIVQFPPPTRGEIQISAFMICIILFILYVFLGAPLGFPKLFVSASAVGAGMPGIKW